MIGYGWNPTQKKGDDLGMVYVGAEKLLHGIQTCLGDGPHRKVFGSQQLVLARFPWQQNPHLPQEL